MMVQGNSQDWRLRGEPDPVDIHVGHRIRLRRILLGKSQEAVALVLGVSFQQLQKYESGANRVSASRLFDLAHVLMAPISYFFDEMPTGILNPSAAEIVADPPSKSVMNESMTLDLIRDFYRLSSAQLRRSVLDLVRAMADGADQESGMAPIRRKPGPKPKAGRIG